MSNPVGKVKFPLWIYPSTHQLVKNNYKKDNCRTMSQFIERAILYYIGRVNADDDTSYLPNAFLSNMKSIVSESDKKTLELLYKLTVEMSVMMNILAVTNDVNYATIQKLRHDCILAMKEAYAKYPFDIVLAWQSGKE